MAIVSLVSKEILLEKEVKNENEVHDYINNHLYDLFGLKLIKKKIKFEDIELDSLCIDINKFLCIIEFKKDHNSEQIAQIIQYSDYIKEHYKEVKKKIGIEFNKDWIQLICIAKEYDGKIIKLVNRLDFEDYDIILFKYKLYKNNYLLLDRVELNKKDNYYFNEFWQSLSTNQKKILEFFLKNFDFWELGFDEETYEDCIIYKRKKKKIIEVWKPPQSDGLRLWLREIDNTKEKLLKSKVAIKTQRRDWIEITMNTNQEITKVIEVIKSYP